MFSLSNRVLGVIDDAREADKTVRDLDESGVPDGDVETLCGGTGVERIDARRRTWQPDRAADPRGGEREPGR